MTAASLLSPDYATPAPVSRSLDDPTPQIQLSVGKEDKNAVVKWGWQAPAGTHVNLKFSVPWDDSNDDTVLADLDGLAHARKLTLSITRILNPKPDTVAMDQVCAAAKKLTSSPDAQCGSNLYEKLTDPKSKHEAYAAYFGALMPVWAFTGVVGEQDFKHFDTSLNEQKDRKVPWSVSLDLALVSAVTRDVFAFGYRRESSFEDDKKRAGVLCNPVTGSTALQCKSGFFAPPAQKEKNVAYLELRHPLKSLAFAPRLSFDFEAHGFGFDLPAYLFKAKDGTYTGGLRAGWKESSHETTLSVFVSSPLETFF